MGTAGRQYPLSIQAKLPLVSTAKSKRQFKPPKRALPREETDSSVGDEVLRSIYEVWTEGDVISFIIKSILSPPPPTHTHIHSLTPQDSDAGNTSSDVMSSDGWLSKRRRRDISEVDRSPASETTVISQ